MSTPVVRAEHISKRFGAVVALSDVNLHLERGEFLGLVGDNGAGKSTFIKILTGFHGPDSGQLYFEGRSVRFSSPAEARAVGIETVYQDLALINDLNVYYNLFLGREIRRRVAGVPLLNGGEMRRWTRAYLAEMAVNVPSVETLVGQLSGGQRQAIAVARALFASPKVLILDEPLAAMGAKEGRHILDLLAQIRQRREVSVILIAHNYYQIFDACDRINLLQQGRIVFDRPTAETSVEELTGMVVSAYRKGEEQAS